MDFEFREKQIIGWHILQAKLFLYFKIPFYCPVVY